MNRGAYWAGTPFEAADAEPNERETALAAALTAALDDSHGRGGEPALAPEPSRTGRLERGGLVAAGLIATAWLAVVLAAALDVANKGGLDAATAIKGVALASAPLALIALLLLLWQRSGSREAAGFAEAARGARTETLALDAVLSLAARRLQQDREAVAAQADQLLALADQTSARLGDATAGLATQVAELGRQNRLLDEAAGTARVDLGVMLTDLPVAAEQVRALAAALRDAGAAAQERSRALEELLAALAERAAAAEQVGSTAAGRLGTELSRIAGAAEHATRRVDEVAQRMNGSVEDALVRVADAMERTRGGVVAQTEAVDALAERATAAAAGAGAALEARLAAVRLETNAIATMLGQQDAVGAALFERIGRGLAALETRFADFDESGRARADRLVDALGQLLAHAERTTATLNDGGVAATTLINRTETLRAAAAACLAELGDALPAALERLEAAAARGRAAVAEAEPVATRLGGALADAGATLAAHGETARALADATGERLATVRGDAERLGAALDEARTRSDRLAEESSGRLVEALLRVRETANQAAERAEQALGAIVPRSAAALGEAGRDALARAVGDSVEQQIGRVRESSDQAVQAAHEAAERLELQLARVAETSAAVDAQVAAGRAEVEEADRANLSRRVALLIDSLNSTAIDVAKLLSNETSDTAWGAYLRGDRGVFTRRAVRLLDAGEAREVARHYEAEPEFREQVNRYVHDFEALLRPVLSTRDGSTLATVLLSSEMGKLYVALAQAIERLRT